MDDGVRDGVNLPPSTLRVTATGSEEDPRGAFPYALSVTEKNNLIVDAVPRSSALLSFEAEENIEFKSALRTDSDVDIKSKVFSQTSPIITEYGAISIEADAVNVLNSLQVLSAPLDENRVDISLKATNGSVSLTGLIEAPNAIEIRQEGKGGSVSGDTRLSADRINVNSIGNIEISTSTRNISIISAEGDVEISEIDDLNVTTLTAGNGDVTLQALGVDAGAEGENAIALKAKILEAKSITVAAPNGSVDVTLDTSNLVELGDKEALISLQNDVTAMDVAGNVVIRSTAGALDVFDGPVAGSSARLVRVATTAPLNAAHSYQGNTPGAFPSTISGAGRLPDIDGVSLRNGDRVLVKDQVDFFNTGLNDESAENGIYVVNRLGGGVRGYQDWQLVRDIEADTREDLLPNSFIRVLEGDMLAGNVYQLNYANVPELSVSRTENNQLVVSGNIGSLLNINVNDIAKGDGIATGARVTGVDYTNGVISLGVQNSFEATVLPVAQQIGQLPGIRIDGSNSRTDLLLDAINAAFGRVESVLVSGAGIPVGAKISSVTGEFPKLDDAGNLILAIETSGIISAPQDGLKVTLGFVSASTGRVSLNPAVRTFLINDVVEETTENVIKMSDTFTNYGALSEGQLVFGDGVAPNTVITKIFPGKKEVHVSPNGLPEDVVFELEDTQKTVELSSDPSAYFGELYTNYLQMPDTFNEYFRLSIGQAVEGLGIEPGAVITAFSPVYRQVGLSAGSILTTQPIQSVQPEPRPVFIVVTTGEVPDPADVITNNREITKVVDTSALTVGMLVTGTNIPDGATIVSIDSPTQTITLSDPVTEGDGSDDERLKFYTHATKGDVPDPTDDDTDNSEITFYTATTTGDVPDPADGSTDNSEITNLSDTSDLIVGMLVTGTNIPDGATIASIDLPTQTITLSAPVTAGTGSTNETLKFTNFSDMSDLIDDLIVGMLVTGTNIPDGATIASIDLQKPDKITLSDPVTAGTGSTNETLKFSIGVSFKSIDSVDFGVINSLGSGTASFSVETFGYVGMDVRTPRVASGLAKIKVETAGESSNTVVVDSLKWKQLSQSRKAWRSQVLVSTTDIEFKNGMGGH